jgi:hypothetical protein
MNKPIAELRALGEKHGREGMSLMAQKFIAEYDGSYKGVMKLCGELSVVAKMAGCDCYWSEKVDDGVRNAVFVAELDKVK